MNSTANRWIQQRKTVYIRLIREIDVCVFEIVLCRARERKVLHAFVLISRITWLTLRLRFCNKPTLVVQIFPVACAV